MILVGAEGFPELPVHLLQGDLPGTARRPDALRALNELLSAQPGAGRPRLIRVVIRRELQHAADIEHNRANGHASQATCAQRSIS